MRWAYAGLVPAGVVAAFVALAGLAAPEHDDYCFAVRTANDGIVPTVVHFYTELTGRITALILIQLPQLLASGLSIGLLRSYPMILVVLAVGFVAGTAAAIACAWRVRGPRLFLLTATFLATVIAVAPSPHELMFWLPGVVCYVPPAMVAICFLAVASRSEWITRPQAAAMALAGFLVAMCNEFTAPWLLLILLLSVAARHVYGADRQMHAHAMIAAAVLAGLAVIVAAPGNAGRRGDLPNSGHLGYALVDSLIYSIWRLSKFVTQPAVFACVAVAAVVAMSFPRSPKPDRRRATVLAMAIVIVCGICCYLEFFVYAYSTGGHLVERAQNQALTLLLFGIALAVSIFARARLPRVIHASPAVVTAIAAIMGASLYFSPTGRLMRAEAGTFMAFHEEALERDQMLRNSTEIVPFVARHKAAPSLLMGVDADVNSGCLARYYGKTEVRVEAKTKP